MPVFKTPNVNQPCLIADVGGTNARFAVAYPTPDQRFEMGETSVLSCAEFESFEALLSYQLNQMSEEKPKQALLALAGPVKGDEMLMTNLGWRLSASALTSAFNLDAVTFVNDFVAQAYAALSLTPEQAHSIIPVSSQPLPETERQPKVVLGPGTGLGIAGLLNDGHYWGVVPSEAGHMRAAASSELAAQVITFLQRESSSLQQTSSSVNARYISYENLLSGAGLENIYRALQHIYGSASASPVCAADISRLAFSQSTTSSQSIPSLSGISKPADIARQAVSLFTQTLASFAGDAALMMCAQGGVYIGGGIFPRWIADLDTSDFISTFQNKGVVSDFMGLVPVQVMTGRHLALQGLCEWLTQQKNRGALT